MSSPQPLRDRALDNLQFIRSTMERAGSFTAVPGWGTVVLGGTALGASVLAGSLPTVATYDANQQHWLLIWLLEAVLAGSIGIAALLYQARRAGDTVTAGPRIRPQRAAAVHGRCDADLRVMECQSTRATAAALAAVLRRRHRHRRRVLAACGPGDDAGAVA